jgi:hypothetical protein
MERSAIESPPPIASKGTMPKDTMTAGFTRHEGAEHAVNPGCQPACTLLMPVSGRFFQSRALRMIYGAAKRTCRKTDQKKGSGAPGR